LNGQVDVGADIRNNSGFTYSIGTSASPFVSINAINFISPANAFIIAAGNCTLQAGNTSGLQVFNSTRNVVLQNGGTFTDSGFRLDVNGTARVQGTASIGNSNVGGRADLGLSVMGFVNNSAIPVTSASGTLLHIENVDQTNNSYANISLRIDAGGNAVYSNISLIKTASGVGSLRIHQQGIQQLALFTNGNLLLQNGGTFTDAGFRLDVNGTARVSGELRVTGTLGSLRVTGTGAEVFFLRDGNNDLLANGGTSSALRIGANDALRFDTGATLTPRMRIKSNGSVRYEPMSTPASAESGDVYYDSSTNKLRCYNGTSWNDLF
jgi:hypothetical protein